ncbi:MAG: UPF0175 family protein [Candidatus Aenigmarchaeota archaeon]|nr:UPF0175 family protein [Candidatus Aenigmarchaeota archaeon]
METVSVRLDEETLQDFEKIMKENRSKVVRELVEDGRKHKAVELYKNKKISLGLGARLAGTTLSGFIDLLKEHNVHLNLELEDVRKSVENARKML